MISFGISEPGQVTNVKILPNVYSLRVTWTPPQRAGETRYVVEACEMPDENCPDDNDDTCNSTIVEGQSSKIISKVAWIPELGLVPSFS